MNRKIKRTKGNVLLSLTLEKLTNIVDQYNYSFVNIWAELTRRIAIPNLYHCIFYETNLSYNVIWQQSDLYPPTPDPMHLHEREH